MSNPGSRVDKGSKAGVPGNQDEPRKEGCLKPFLRLPWGLPGVQDQGTLTLLSPGFLVVIRAREINPRRAKIKKDSRGLGVGGAVGFSHGPQRDTPLRPGRR